MLSAILVFTFMIIVVFFVIFTVKKSEIAFKNKFGSINCEALLESYSTSDF
jgi:hypothetical protein